MNCQLKQKYVNLNNLSARSTAAGSVSEESADSVMQSNASPNSANQKRASLLVTSTAQLEERDAETTPTR